MWMFMSVHVFLYIFLWLDVSLDSINIHVRLCTTSHFHPLDSYLLWFSAQHMLATASSYQWYFTLPLLCVPTSYLAVPVPTSVSTCFLLICRPLIFYSFHAGFIFPFLIVWLVPLCTPLALSSVLFISDHRYWCLHASTCIQTQTGGHGTMNTRQMQWTFIIVCLVPSLLYIYSMSPNTH